MVGDAVQNVANAHESVWGTLGAFSALFVVGFLVWCVACGVQVIRAGRDYRR